MLNTKSEFKFIFAIKMDYKGSKFFKKSHPKILTNIEHKAITDLCPEGVDPEIVSKILEKLKKEWYQNRCVDVITYYCDDIYHLYAPTGFTDNDVKGEKTKPTTNFAEKLAKYGHLRLDYHERTYNGTYKLIFSITIKK